MRAPTNLRAALVCALALGLVTACDDEVVPTDAGTDAGIPGLMDAGRDGGGGGEDDAGSGEEDAGSGEEDAGTSEDDAGTSEEDGGLDGGVEMDGGSDSGMADSGPPDGGTTPLSPVINEFAYAHNSSAPTGQNDNEYIEVFGEPNTDYSDLWILYVNGNAPGSSGRIDLAVQVGTTDANGFWVWRDPDDDTDGDELRNSSSTLLLVRNFTGAELDDLDTDNDLMLDATLPFDEILDSVSTQDADGEADAAYSTTILARGFPGGSGNVAAASRIPNGVDTDTMSDWVRNDGAGLGLPGGPTTADDGEAYNTPGAENAIYTSP